MSATTALGWSSRIFNLGAGIGNGLDDVARAVASGTAVGVSDDAARVATALQNARGTFQSTISGLRGGATGTEAARGFQALADELTSVRRLAQGRVSGHVNGAANEANAIRAALDGAGSVTPKVTPQLETQVWQLRYHLDEGFNELGMAKVMGQLR